MREVTIRLVVVALTVVAFVLTAVSGLVLFMPGRLLPVLAISLLQWRTIHEWSALVLTAAVVAHLVLNQRRVGEMLARLWRPAGPPQGAPAPAQPHDGPAPGRSPDTPAPVPGGSQDLAHDLAPAAAATPGGQHRLRLSRRWFLVLAAGAGAAVIAALGLGPAGSRPSAGRRGGSGSADRLTSFPVLNVEDGPPAVPAASWVVEVDGLVEHRLHLDRTAWLALPRTQETRTFHCVEGWSVDHLGWEGVRVADLLSLAGPQAGGRFVTFHASGGTYSDSLTLDEAQAPETLLADSLDGAPLPAAHGGPLRLVIPSQLGYKNVKWVVRLEVTATRARGYWEGNGYPAEAPVA